MEVKRSEKQWKMTCIQEKPRKNESIEMGRDDLDAKTKAKTKIEGKTFKLKILACKRSFVQHSFNC